MNFLALIKLVLERKKKKKHDEPEQSRDLKSFFHAIDKHQLSMRQLGRERQKKNEGTVTRNYESRGNNGQTRTTFGIGRGVGTRSSGPVVFQVSP